MKLKKNVLCGLTAAVLAANMVSIQAMAATEFVYAATIAADHPTVTLDRYNLLATGNIYTLALLWGDTLIATDMEDHYTPWLATSWEWNEDYTSVTMHLRENVRFHDGSALDAGDVKVTYDRFIGNDQMANNKWKDYLESTRVIDDHTIVLNLVQPMASFNAECAQTPIIPEWAADDLEAFFVHPVGTGPYKLERFDVEAFDLDFTRNADWWGLQEGHETYVDTIRQVGMTDQAESVEGVKNGEIDYAIIETASQETVDELKNMGFSTYDFLSSKHFYLAYNFNDGSVWNDPNLRQALSLCLDRDKIAAAYGAGVAATYPCQPTDAGYADNGGYEYNLEKAQSLVAASGYDGSTIYVRLADKKTWEVIQPMMEAAGFHVETAEADGHYDLYYDTKTDRTVELYDVYKNDKLKLGYPDETFRTLIEEGAVTVDAKRQTELRTQIYAHMTEQFAPSITLFDKLGRIVYVPELTGFKKFATDYSDFRYVKFEEEKE